MKLGVASNDNVHIKFCENQSNGSVVRGTNENIHMAIS